MKAAITTWKRALGRIHRESRIGRYAQALAEVDRLLTDWPNNPRLLILRGNLIQLQDEDAVPTLEDARHDLERAVELAEESPAALIELAHFLFAVEDDDKAAARHFDKAIALGKRLLKDALVGKAAVLADMERRPEAVACLAEAYWLQTHNGKAANGSISGDILKAIEDLGSAK
jgi:tetratricopeptide (TPR) repeat protein